MIKPRSRLTATACNTNPKRQRGSLITLLLAPRVDMERAMIGRESAGAAVKPFPRWRVGLVCAVVACCSVARGDASSADARDLHQKQIAEKSESERARLQHNFREFRKLPAAEQEKLRLLNRLLKTDDRDNGGLRAIMVTYHDWLATLSVGQREDVLNQADPNKREKRVRELLKEQQEHAASIGSGGGVRAQRALSSEDLSAVLGVVKKALLDRQVLSDHEKAQLDEKVGLARHMSMVELAYRRPVLPRDQVGFAPKVVDAMIAAVSNPRQAKNLQSREKPMERGWLMFMLIKGGLMNEYERNKPEAGALELFFVQLPPDKQDEVMRLPHDEQQKKLTHMYLEKRSEDDPNHFPRPPRPGFWMMQPPPGFRPQGQGGGGQRGAEGDQSQKQNPRKKGNKNAEKQNKAATKSEKTVTEPEEAPEGE